MAHLIIIFPGASSLACAAAATSKKVSRELVAQINVYKLGCGCLKPEARSKKIGSIQRTSSASSRHGCLTVSERPSQSMGSRRLVC